jgi:putative peptidoglycan binding protein
MALKSQILSGNSRLERAAVGPPSVKPAPPKDDLDAVRRIQRALVALGHPLPKSFPDGATKDPDGKYGQETYEAVIAFQKRVFPGKPDQWDGRVGKNTLKNMDDKLSPATPSTKTLTIIPFHEASPLLISQQNDNRAKNDLKSTKTPLVLHLPVLSQLMIAEARGTKTSDLKARMDRELGGLGFVLGGGFVGSALLDDFTRNSTAKAEIPHSVGSPLSNLVDASPEFRKVRAEVEGFVTDAVRASASTGILDYTVLAEPGKKVPPPSLGFRGRTDPLHVMIGSFQGVSIFLNDFKADALGRRYTADLTYEFIDHFGVDDTDTILDTSGHGSPGQVALWVLQRERHPGHMPYVTEVFINDAIDHAF